MLKTLRRKYKVLNSYALRTPLFSIEKLFELYADESIEKKIWAFLEDPIFSEALYLASPELWELAQKEYGKGIAGKGNHKMTLTLLKYITRICTRATPFGLFAGTAVGKFDRATHIVIAEKSKHRRKTRLDFEFLAQVTNKLSENGDLRKHLRFYPNTSLYKGIGEFRYIETRFEGGRKRYILQRLLSNEILDVVIEESRSGLTFNELVERVSSYGHGREEAEGYIEQLLDFQILISELTPYVVGRDFVDHLLNLLPDSLKFTERTILGNLKEDLSGLDSVIGNSIEKYKKALTKAKVLEPQLNRKHLIQVDIYPSYVHNTLSSKTKNNISQALDVLAKLFEAELVYDMQDFVKHYEERYGERAMPLTDVLDRDYGIGYPIDENRFKYPYLEKVVLGNPSESEKGKVKLDRTALFFFRQIEKSREGSIDLKECDLSEFPLKDPYLSETFSTLAKIYSQNGKELIYLDGFGGSSAIQLLGRFSEDEPQIREAVREAAQLEQERNRENLVAEIAYLPENRVGNVLFRDNFRGHQINYLSGINYDRDSCIDIDDLMISLKKGQLVLFSKKNGQRIRPYLSNAHNYQWNELPIYRFLCDYQIYPNSKYLWFKWGGLEALVRHLPRVTYGNIVLSKAQWTYESGPLKEALKRILNRSGTTEQIEEWARKEKLPRYVQLAQSDNLLLIDLKSEISVRMLLDALPKNNMEKCKLLEFLVDDTAIVRDDIGLGFTHEFLFMLSKRVKDD